MRMSYIEVETLKENTNYLVQNSPEVLETLNREAKLLHFSRTKEPYLRIVRGDILLGAKEIGNAEYLFKLYIDSDRRVVSLEDLIKEPSYIVLNKQSTLNSIENISYSPKYSKRDRFFYINTEGEIQSKTLINSKDEICVLETT